jgi:hypothetical protein
MKDGVLKVNQCFDQFLYVAPLNKHSQNHDDQEPLIGDNNAAPKVAEINQRQKINK